MPPTEMLETVRDVVQIVSSLVVILVGLVAMVALRRAGRAGNRVQIEIDLQVIDLGNGELIGELAIALQNMGSVPQRLRNLFIEVRPSRHVGGGGLAVVPVTNLIAQDDYPLVTAPGVRQLLTWTFEIDRDERLLRATALINTGKWLPVETVPSLSQKHFWNFGPSIRYTSRVFDVSASPFRRM